MSQNLTENVQRLIYIYIYCFTSNFFNIDGDTVDKIRRNKHRSDL